MFVKKKIQNKCAAVLDRRGRKGAGAIGLIPAGRRAKIVPGGEGAALAADA
jgi:hypothetical protein